MIQLRTSWPVRITSVLSYLCGMNVSSRARLAADVRRRHCNQRASRPVTLPIDSQQPALLVRGGTKCIAVKKW
jgi:hypothetical protein